MLPGVAGRLGQLQQWVKGRVDSLKHLFVGSVRKQQQQLQAVLQGQRNHPSLPPREEPRAPSWSADIAVGKTTKLEPDYSSCNSGVLFLNGHFLTALLQRIWEANL